MASWMNIVYYLLNTVWQLVQDLFPLRFLGYKKFLPLSPETRNRVLEIISELKKQETRESKKGLLTSLSCEEDLLSVTDISGYNLLQHAVICKDLQIVRCLLRLGFDPDKGACSSPLQIASRLGHRDSVLLLVEYGAKIHKYRGMCYPKQHVPVFYRANYLALSPQAVYECNSRWRTPIQCAIDGDHVDIMKSLYFRISNMLPYQATPSDLLHYACTVGSLNCMKYLLLTWPDLIEVQNSDGDTPLLLAVPCGQLYILFLIEHGANIRIRSQQNDTVLHRLYRSSQDSYSTILSSTKLLLSSGLEEDINEKNFEGETALHILVGHISHMIGDEVPDINTSRDRTDQIRYQTEIVKCLDVLLEYNADVNSINNLNLQPLCKLMHIAFSACYPDDPNLCVPLHQGSYYVNDYETLNKALEILLAHGADPNFQCDSGHNSLILLLQCMLFDREERLCDQGEYFIGCLRTLLSHGAVTNFVTSSDATCSTLLAKIGLRYFKIFRSGEPQDAILQDKFSDLLNSCLSLMLEFGLNPNHTTNKKSPYLQGGIGNALIEFVRLAEHVAVPKDLTAIHKWLRTLLQWGADPDIEPYPSHPIICHSQSSIFLKKQASQPVSHYIHEAKELQFIFSQGYAMDLLLLFYSTMDHQILYECLRSARFMSRFYPMGATGQDFLSRLNELTDNPRSLKDCSRVAVYKALNRSLATKVPELPLPNRLKQFLLEIEL